MRKYTKSKTSNNKIDKRPLITIQRSGQMVNENVQNQEQPLRHPHSLEAETRLMMQESAVEIMKILERSVDYCQIYKLN